MAKPDVLIVSGHGYSWKHLCELRRRQLQEWEAAQAAQPALFELRKDHRPAASCSATGRYLEPSLFDTG